MKFRKSLIGAGVATALSMAAVSANAVYLPGGIQELEDENAEVILRDNGNGYEIVSPAEIADAQGLFEIQEGDLFAGVIKVQQTQIISPISGGEVSLQQTSTFTSIFLIETSADPICGALGTPGNPGIPTDCSVPDGSTDFLSFGAADSDTWSEVFGNGGQIDISDVFDVDNIEDSGEEIEAGTAALFFLGVEYADATRVSLDEDNSGVIEPDEELSLVDSVKSFVEGGVLQHEVGFTGAPGEFWTTTGTDAVFPALLGSAGATNRISLNVTQTWSGPELLFHNFLGDPTGGNDMAFTEEVQFQGAGGFQPTAPGPWGLGTDTNFYINADIPAPGGLALVAIGLLGLGFRARSASK